MCDLSRRAHCARPLRCLNERITGGARSDSRHRVPIPRHAGRFSSFHNRQSQAATSGDKRRPATPLFLPPPSFTFFASLSTISKVSSNLKSLKFASIVHERQLRSVITKNLQPLKFAMLRIRWFSWLIPSTSLHISLNSSISTFFFSR